jgi:hypothetical protein
MKKLLTLILAAIAPVAFAQVSTTTTETTQAPAVTTTTETVTTGTVTSYEPGKVIVVNSDTGPVRFALGTASKIIDGLAPGKKVKVYYSPVGEERIVSRVEFVN